MHFRECCGYVLPSSLFRNGIHQRDNPGWSVRHSDVQHLRFNKQHHKTLQAGRIM